MAVDIAGERFGKLVAREVAFVDGVRLWKCDCDCGGETIARAAGLRFGDNVSCGCAKDAVAIKCAVCDRECRRKKSKPGRFCSHKCYWKSKEGRGDLNWNKGYPGYTTKRKGRKYIASERMVLANIENGKKRRGKKNRSVHLMGAAHPQWKGNRSEREQLRSSAEHKRLLHAVFTRDGFTCQICGDSKCFLHMDHIKKWADFPELRFVESNCRTLCCACHFFVTFGRPMPEGSRWGMPTKRKEG